MPSCMIEDNCKLWELDVRTGLSTQGHVVRRMGSWNELFARIELASTPNGTYAIESSTRRCVYRKTGNYGDGVRLGTVVLVDSQSD